MAVIIEDINYDVICLYDDGQVKGEEVQALPLHLIRVLFEEIGLSFNPELPIAKGGSSRLFTLFKNDRVTQDVIKIIASMGPGLDQLPYADLSLNSRRFSPNLGDHLFLNARHPSLLTPTECFYLDEDMTMISNHPRSERSQLIGLVMSRFEGTILNQVMKEELEVEEILDLAFQIGNGLCYLNANRIVHGDVDGENILVSPSRKKAVLVDFGLSRMMIADDGFKGDIKGRSLSLAPEIIEKNKQTIRSEAWSFGILFYQMLHKGRFPFQTKQEILNLPLWIDPTLPYSIQNLLVGLLERDPEKRIRIYEIPAILKREIEIITQPD